MNTLPTRKSRRENRMVTCMAVCLLLFPLVMAHNLRGQSENVAKTLEHFLLTEDQGTAFGVCATMFKQAYLPLTVDNKPNEASFTRRAVKLDVTGPVLLRNAAASTKVPELKATYTDLAADISLYGRCLNGSGLHATSNDWWASSPQLDWKSKYCIASSELSTLSSLL